VTKLSAFADEISPDLDEQVSVLLEEGIRFIDLRSVQNVNVLDLDDRRVAEIRSRLQDAGIGIAAIASALGKMPVDVDLGELLRRLDRAIELASTFGADFIRIFSFYPPEQQPSPLDWSRHREEVIRRLRAMTEHAAAAGITLLHENDRDLYGDSIERCVDVLKGVGDSHFQAAFDPANFIQCGETPYTNAYEALQPWIRYVHVKDATADGRIVAAGEGDAHWPDLLAALHKAGYDGFFSLEPHLAAAGRFQGFSGPDLFRHAAKSFLRLASVPTREPMHPHDPPSYT
jgi:3-dehydroshikimate dehydratase